MSYGSSAGDRRSITGIEWLRAAAAIMVVQWHMLAFGKPLGAAGSQPRSLVPNLTDLINFQVLLTAVPLFLAISCYLFAKGEATLKRRLPKILLLLAFWPAAFLIWQGSIWGILDEIPRRPLDFVVFLLQAGHTIYYFFLDLILCLLLCSIARRLNTPSLILACVLTCAIALLMPLLAIRSGRWILVAYWNPLNFLLFPFASTLLARSSLTSRQAVTTCTLLLVATVGVAVFEWSQFVHPVFLRGNDSLFPSYSRLSSGLTAYLALIIALTLQPPLNSIVRYLAANSLALYCVHPFVLTIIHGKKEKLAFLYNHPHLGTVVVIACSFGIAHALRLFLRKELLS